MDTTVREFLEEIRFAVLATVGSSGAPQQTVVWYELQGNEIVMNTKRGRRKDRNLLRQPLASFCVEDGYRYVVITGSVSLNDDQAAAQADIERLAIRYHGPTKAAEQMRDQFSREERVTIRLSIDRLHANGFQ